MRPKRVSSNLGFCPPDASGTCPVSITRNAPDTTECPAGDRRVPSENHCLGVTPRLRAVVSKLRTGISEVQIAGPQSSRVGGSVPEPAFLTHSWVLPVLLASTGQRPLGNHYLKDSVTLISVTLRDTR